MLEVSGLNSGYGTSRVLNDVSFTVGDGSVTSLIGRNGMGKTTSIKTIMGMIKPFSGAIRVNGKDLCGAEPFEIARAGLGLVPEGRRVFRSLSVAENLLATRSTRRSVRWTLARIFGLFPVLEERQRQLASTLSGGEQQMLVIGRALMTNPSLLILDEATEGLAPLIRQTIWHCLASLKTDGESILVVDKYSKQMSEVVDHNLIMEKGRIVWGGSSAALNADPSVTLRYLGL
ncbi:MAG: ABC transporter ATP-binding protein [Ramlibacter sp.]